MARIAGRSHGTRDGRPRPGGHHDHVGFHLPGRGGDPPAIAEDLLDLDPLHQVGAEGERLVGQRLDDGTAVGPARPGVEVAVRVVFGVPPGESRLDRGAVQALQGPTASREGVVAVVLEAARLHGTAAEHEETGLVVQQAQEVVPVAPALERLGHEVGVEGIGAVVGADELADVGGRRQGMRNGAGVDDVDVPAALGQLDGRRQAEHSATDDQGLHVSRPRRRRRRTGCAPPA